MYLPSPVFPIDLPISGELTAYVKRLSLFHEKTGGFKGEGEIYTKEETIMGTNRTKSSEPREAIEHARMRYCLVGATGAVAHAPTPTSAHNALWNKCVFIAAVAVAALLLKLAASSCCCCCCRWLLLPPLFLFLQDARLSSSSPRFSCSARRERERGAPSQMGPSDLHKAVLSSTHTATRWPLLLTVRARVSRTRVPFIKGAAHERAPRGHRSAAHALLR